MSTNSSIEWTDATWNPLAGCTAVSPGCLNCYAANIAYRFGSGNRPKQHFVGLATKRDGRAVFTGKVKMLEHRLKEPLGWRRPRRIFVNSMSDLFHEDVPFDFIDRVFAVMALCPQHTFQVLTKRPARMAEYLASTPDRKAKSRLRCVGMQMSELGANLPINRLASVERVEGVPLWPLPNVWLGTSVEDQQRADERIPELLKCPAAVRFLSVEPLLDEILVPFGEDGEQCVICPLTGEWAPDEPPPVDGTISWVIVGGESGPKSRPCNVEWIRSIVEQCKAASVPCFVKQMGAALRMPFTEWNQKWSEHTDKKDFTLDAPNAEQGIWRGQDRKGGTAEEWADDLRVREMPAAPAGVSK